jgi:hypothetical protein
MKQRLKWGSVVQKPVQEWLKIWRFILMELDTCGPLDQDQDQDQDQMH